MRNQGLNERFIGRFSYGVRFVVFVQRMFKIVQMFKAFVLFVEIAIVRIVH